ncbi:MAG TPA: B12-binding domain-containing protein [Acidimicrobiia bacterium]
MARTRTRSRGDEWLTLQEAARRLGVHYMTAYRYVRIGRLPAVSEEGRWWVRASDVEAHGRPGPESAPGRGRTASGRQRERLLRRLVAGDEAGAWAVLESARAAGAGARDLYVRLLAPVLHRIGDQWASGAIDVGDEHVATATTERLLGRLSQELARRGRRRGTLVLGVVPGDRHGLPLALLAGVARAEGYDVVELGADTPVESLVRAARAADRLVAVGVSAATPGHEEEAAAAITALRAAVDVPVLVGGPAIDEAGARRLGADGWAPDAAAAMDLVGELTA